VSGELARADAHLSAIAESYASASAAEPNTIVFFLQAEDGIRDRDVTGVQTCALPIFILMHAITLSSVSEPAISIALAMKSSSKRSEERRVGKESTSGSGAYQHNERQLVGSRGTSRSALVAYYNTLADHLSSNARRAHS